jgi:hypothetical protein
MTAPPVFRAAILMLMLASLPARADLAGAASARLDADFAAGRPLVAHVVVALVDNRHQGIVPVPAALGDGGDPRSNLYWGAMYGVPSYFRRAGWQRVPVAPSKDARVLERALFRLDLTRGGRPGEMFVLAEAWRGERIADAIRHYFELDRGLHAHALRAGERELLVGGGAHVLAFVGHNGLMDFAAPDLPAPLRPALAHANIVLACYSHEYFAAKFSDGGLALLMTHGLMAPEAYTLDAAVRGWFAGEDPGAVRRAAARAYARYQKVSERAASRLFQAPVDPARQHRP